MINDSVNKRLISDVPLGAFLSGGIDSSLIVALLCRFKSPDSIKTFSIGFDLPEFDETRYSKMVSEYLGTDHRIISVTPKDILEAFFQIAPILDEPNADFSLIPTYILAKNTRKEVTVALSGDGGDELFAGYSKYYLLKMTQHLGIIPKPFFRMAHTLFGKLGFQSAEKFFKSLEYPMPVRDIFLSAPFTPDEIELVLRKEIAQEAKDIFENIDLVVKSAPEMKNALDQATYVDIKLTLPDLYLQKVDRMCMACSLEVRLPYLKRELVEFATSLPESLKLKGTKGKHIEKQIAKEFLPVEVIARRKSGFSVPVGIWFRNELKPLLLTYLSDECIHKHEILDSKYVKKILREHLEEKRDHSYKLWCLLILQVWLENFHVPS